MRIGVQCSGLDTPVCCFTSGANCLMSESRWELKSLACAHARSFTHSPSFSLSVLLSLPPMACPGPQHMGQGVVGDGHGGTGHRNHAQVLPQSAPSPEPVLLQRWDPKLFCEEDARSPGVALMCRDILQPPGSDHLRLISDSRWKIGGQRRFRQVCLGFHVEPQPCNLW